MTEYYKNRYRSTPSRRVNQPVSMYPTRSRQRRMRMLVVVLATAVIVVLGSLSALVWGVKGLIGGGPGPGATANSVVSGDTDVTTTPDGPADTSGPTDTADTAGSSGSETLVASASRDYEVAPLIDLAAFRDASYVPIKAFHVTSDKAANKASMGRIMDLIDRTEINALVVEVKDEYGRVAFDSDAPMAVKNGTVKPIIWGGDVTALLDILAERKIFPIARVVCFKDSRFAKARPDLALVDKNTGQPWKDYKGNLYLNPYMQEAWEYIVQVAEDAARKGFREIQFDYIRFPDGLSGDLSTISYPGQYGEKVDAIAGFLAYARPRLQALGVWVSADIFGWVLEDGSVKGIGQDLGKMAKNVDIVCPMVYPDHYPLGYGGIAYPPAEPYKTITRALSKAEALVQGTGTKCRPYLQAYRDIQSQRIDYTPKMIKEEIRAAADLGFNEYVLWAGYPDLGGQ
jgi:hypothetical protein